MAAISDIKSISREACQPLALRHAILRRIARGDDDYAGRTVVSSPAPRYAPRLSQIALSRGALAGGR
jgi:hypothetical protein